MLMPILTLLSALSISGVAIFYSVIGLATIFPGAFWPVVIMGSVLEVGKLVTASWVYRNWKFTPWLLKSYLVIAVIVLSFITSMGIFGFLSKAHLEQNLAEDTVTQRIQIINDKILSQETYIDRQEDIIERAEKTLSVQGKSNSDAILIEQNALEDLQDKFKTLLAVETNTVKDLNDQLKTTLKDLNDRLRTLDKDVSDVLTSNKSFFNEEKAAADLKASQKEEREQIQSKITEAEETIAIKIAEAQARIQTLKDDYAKDTAVIQSRIDKLREGEVDDKSGVYVQIESAEINILNAQNTIDDLVMERQPLESQVLKLEAEVGPVKYIAALAVDWGIADEVNTNTAVRWVILIIIFVFDPLAVLLLIAANQSLVKRFPPKAPKPQTVIDLEKPDDEDVTLKWNDMMQKANAQAKSEQANVQLKDWKSKLDVFNSKVVKPETKHVEIIQDSDDDDRIEPTLDAQKKTDDKEIVADNTDGFDPDEVMFDLPTEEEIDKKAQLEKFKQKEKEEQAALEEYARKAREEDEPSIAEQIKEVMEPERIKPDFTEVVEPETAINQQKTSGNGLIGQVLVNKKGKPVDPVKSELPNPAKMTEFERTGFLNKLHAEHGKYEDISDEELKMERDESNKAQFLADVSLTKEEADIHPAITESRMAYFQDMIDDILRGNTTYENVPEELRKTLAQIMDPEMPNPPIITKGSALKEQHPEGIEEMSAESLKEKFMAQPKTEDRPMTDDELDKLLEGWEEEQKPEGKTKMIIKDGKKVFVPVEDEYVQNEEQNENTIWNKTKELDIPEPEKNEIILPELNSIEEGQVVDIAESIQIDSVISKDKFDTYKKRITTDTDYHSRIEARINDLITKLENDEIKLKDLTDEDQKVIIDILNQNG
jgi:uncharacterized protein YfcZ (UPF0381/DUF406 family)